MFKRCKHKWTKQSDIIMKSGLEDLLNHSLRQVDGWSTNLLQKTHVVILTCDLCGVVHKEVTHNIE